MLVVVADARTGLAFLAFLLALTGLIAAVVALGAAAVALVRRRRPSSAMLAIVATLELAALAASAILVLSPQLVPIPAAFSAPTQLDSYLRQLVATGSPPSMSAIVVKDGRTVYSRSFGYAYRPAGDRASPDTVDKWWSVTKIATAVAVLQLAEQDKLRLDQPVHELLPAFHAEPSSRARRITVAQLLNHSAGLPSNVPAVVGWMHLEGERPVGQYRFFEDRFGTYARVQREPGELGVYSNVDYLVLGALIEHVSGTPYEQYVTEHILRPLGMTHTAFAYSDWMRAHEGVGSHPAANPQTLLLPLVDPPWPTSYIRAYDGG